MSDPNVIIAVCTGIAAILAAYSTARSNERELLARCEARLDSLERAQ